MTNNPWNEEPQRRRRFFRLELPLRGGIFADSYREVVIRRVRGVNEVRASHGDPILTGTVWAGNVPGPTEGAAYSALAFTGEIALGDSLYDEPKLVGELLREIAEDVSRQLPLHAKVPVTTIYDSHTWCRESSAAVAA
jgi:hypothetical protein